MAQMSDVSSRPTSPLRTDHAHKLTEFITFLSSEREPVATELDVLRSIYGDEAIRVWRPSKDAAGSTTIRYEVDANLPPHENIHIQVLVSLAHSYPASSPPQLQLLSRYIGSFSVSPELLGDVFKTFYSLESPVSFSPDMVVVFDGFQHVVDISSAWYSDRLSAKKSGELVREAEKFHHSIINISTPKPQPPLAKVPDWQDLPVPPEIPVDVAIFEGEAIMDRKSVFIGRACRIAHPSQVWPILSFLLADSRIARAASPIIHAWTFETDDLMYYYDHNDNGITGAATELFNLMRRFQLDRVLLVVTRFFGGIYIGPDRFKHITEAALSALEKSPILKIDQKSQRISGASVIAHPRGKGS